MRASRGVTGARLVVLAFALSAALVPAAGTAANGARTRLSTASHEAAADVTSNWAGYAAVGLGSTATTASPTTAFTDVTGQWKQPKASCTPGSPTSVALWVGLGGYSVNATALEQTGTSADCNGNGQATYYAWYELVPADSVTVKLKIDPGDVIASSVVVNGSDVLVQVIDRTRHTRFTKHLTMANPDLTSAEWIAEAPSQCGGAGFCRQVDLTNFGSVSFARCFAKSNAVGGTIGSPNWMATNLQLVPEAHRFFGQRNDPSATAGGGATASTLAPGGAGFSIAWNANPQTTTAAPTATGM
jgi:Peptidase A4 family